MELGSLLAMNIVCASQVRQSFKDAEAVASEGFEVRRIPRFPAFERPVFRVGLLIVISRFRSVFFHILVLCGVYSAHASADDIILGWPPEVRERIEPLLLPYDLSTVDLTKYDPAISDNVVLLNDSVVYVAEDGTIYEVFHRIYSALTDGNLRYLGEDTYRFRPDTQKIFVVTAETIQKDGRQLPVREEGMIHQTPQRDADRGIYSGREELLLIFSGVEQGAIVRSIIIRESREGRIPGEFSDYWIWTSSWQTDRKRVLLDVPESLAQRLEFYTLGSPVPPRENLDGENGRKRFVWEDSPLADRSWEAHDAPLIQTGPLNYVTTLESWDAFAAWYSELLDERSELPESLLAESREWVSGAESSREVLDVLFEKVARDVRYTSIDFGYAGFQPQSAESVWNNKFGDCKDKSNLLRLLLKANGIEAYLTLINTDHAGRVDRRAPDYRYFDHAIVTAILPDGTRIFCDPTLSYGWPGLITLGNSGRPALMIEPETSSGTWVQTPQVDPEILNYEFDLDLDDAGRLSGWFSLSAENSYSAYFRKRFEGEDHEYIRREVRKYVRYLFPQADVIDFEIESSDDIHEPFRMRAYLVTSLVQAGERVEVNLGWPDINWLLPDVGPDNSVTRPAFLDADHVDVTFRVGLPDRYWPVSIPGSFSVSAPPFSSKGEWTFDAEAVSVMGEVSFATSDPLVNPGQFTSFFNAVDATDAWIDQQIRLGEGENRPMLVRQNPSDGRALEMEMMPTGRGQIDLVDQLYPEGPDNEMRKRALELAGQWFPKDPQVQFEVGIRLAWILVYEDKPAEALESTRKLIRDGEGWLDSISLGWVHYLEGVALLDLGENEEALGVFQSLADDSRFSDYRRAWANYQMGQLLEDQNPTEGLERYWAAFELLEREREYYLRAMSELAMEGDLGGEFSEYLQRVIDENPDFVENLIGTLQVQSVEWMERGQGSLRSVRLLRALEQVQYEGDVLASRSEFDSIRGFQVLTATYQGIQSDLHDYLRENLPEFWNETSFEEDARTQEELTSAVDEAEAEWRKNDAARLALTKVLKNPGDASFPKAFWKAVLYLDWREKDDELPEDDTLDYALNLGERFFEESDEFIELRFLRAKYHNRRNDLDEEYEVFRGLMGADIGANWQDSLTGRAGLNREQASEFDEALEIYLSVEDLLAEDLDMAVQLVRAVYIYLEDGDLNEAEALIARIYPIIADVEETNTAINQLRRWNDHREAGTLRDLWSRQEVWWPQWEALALAWKGKAIPESGHVVPMIGDLSVLGGELGTALQGNDRDETFQIYRRLIHAARWDSYFVPEVQATIRLGDDEFPDAMEEANDLVVALFESLPIADDPVWRNSLYFSILSLDQVGDQKTGMELVEEYFGVNPTEDSIYRAIERVGALFATNLNLPLDEWIARLRGQLNTVERENYVYTVNVLARALRTDGQFDEEEALLSDYVSRFPYDDSAIANTFKVRMQEIEEVQRSVAVFEVTYSDWLKQDAPEWLSWMPGLDLASYSPDRVAFMLEDGSYPGESLFEQTHFLAIAAKDPRLDLQEREWAFSALIQMIPQTTATVEEAHGYLQSIYEEEEFSEEIRTLGFWMDFVSLVFSQDMKLVNELKTTSFYTEPVAVYGPDVKEDLLQICELDLTLEEEVLGFLDEMIAEARFHQVIPGLLMVSFEALLEQGNFEVAEKYLAKVAASSLGRNRDLQYRNIRLEIIRSIESARGLAPLDRILGQAFGELIEAFPGEAALPEENYLGQDVVGYWAGPDLKAFFRYHWVNRFYDRESLLLWSSFFRYSSRNKVLSTKIWERLPEIAPSLLESVDDDESAFFAAFLFTLASDLDNPEQRDFTLAQFRAIRELGSFPSCEDFMNSVELDARLRTGESFDIEAIAAGNKKVASFNVYEGEVIEYYLSRNQLSPLERYLKTVPVETAFSEAVVSNYLRALKLCGLEGEYQFAAEEAMEILQKGMALSLINQEPSHYRFVFNLAAVMPEDYVLDPEWIKAMRERVRPPEKLYFETRASFYEKDWERTLVNARQLVDELPKYYNNYFYLGMANFQLGNYSQASEAFAVFCKFAKDSPYWPEATRLLQIIEEKK